MGLKGTKQKIDNTKTRKRNAAYPFELPYRLINMYSLQNDTVLDPFLGTGTTILAAIASNRNSIGYEIDPMFLDIIQENILSENLNYLNSHIETRIKNHHDFIINRQKDPKKKSIKHYNSNLELPVITSQEKNIKFLYLEQVRKDKDNIIAEYSDYKPQMKIPVIASSKTGRTLFD